MSDSEYEFIEWLRTYRDRCRWQAARSDPPHEYTIRSWRPDAADDFVKAANGIRAFGYPEAFYSHVYCYFDLDSLKYWTIGAPLEETVVINRCPVEN
jgi:hypothetical protein